MAIRPVPFKNCAALNSPADNVMKRTGSVYAGLSWHKMRIKERHNCMGVIYVPYGFNICFICMMAGLVQPQDKIAVRSSRYLSLFVRAVSCSSHNKKRFNSKSLVFLFVIDPSTAIRMHNTRTEKNNPNNIYCSFSLPK